MLHEPHLLQFQSEFELYKNVLLQKDFQRQTRCQPQS